MAFVTQLHTHNSRTRRVTLPPAKSGWLMPIFGNDCIDREVVSIMVNEENLDPAASGLQQG